MCTHTKRQAQRDRHRDDLRLDDSGWRWSPEPSLILIKRLHDNQYHNISILWLDTDLFFVFEILLLIWMANTEPYSVESILCFWSLFILTQQASTHNSHMYIFFSSVCLCYYEGIAVAVHVFSNALDLCVLFIESVIIFVCPFQCWAYFDCCFSYAYILNVRKLCIFHCMLSAFCLIFYLLININEKRDKQKKTQNSNRLVWNRCPVSEWVREWEKSVRKLCKTHRMTRKIRKIKRI